MHRVLISLGTNLGNRIGNLQRAALHISEQIGDIQQVGGLYETEPWGFNSDNWFMNTAIELKTKLSPDELLQKCMSIERNLGRKRDLTKTAYSSRLIDIDILFFDNEIIDLPELTIPHRHLHKRKFVLKPLNDIAPNFIHPILKQTIKILLENCTDKMELLNVNQKLKL